MGWVNRNSVPNPAGRVRDGGAGNFGSYSTTKTDSLIRATEFTEVKLTAYENYLTEQLSVLWQPNFVSSITEIHKGLKGVTPQNVEGTITPANWHWSS